MCTLAKDSTTLGNGGMESANKWINHALPLLKLIKVIILKALGIVLVVGIYSAIITIAVRRWVFTRLEILRTFASTNACARTSALDEKLIERW